MIFRVVAAPAEFIRELIAEGTHEGLAAARARGQRLERPSAMTADQIRHAPDPLTRPENTVSSIARPLRVSRSTIYKYVPERTTDRPAVEPSTVRAGRGAGSCLRSSGSILRLMSRWFTAPRAVTTFIAPSSAMPASASQTRPPQLRDRRTHRRP
ncbi:hypothetical protein GCM10010486_33580 [Nonomuraea roseoviolacea subsp. carminata]